jgi:hypothetical protein
VSAPRLEWTPSGNGNVSRAEVGPYVLLAWKQGWWEVRVNSEAKHKEHDEGDLRSAQLAAEAACRSLLIEALVAFKPDVDWLIVPSDPTFGMCVEATGLERDGRATATCAIARWTRRWRALRSRPSGNWLCARCAGRALMRSRANESARCSVPAVPCC